MSENTKDGGFAWGILTCRHSTAKSQIAFFMTSLKSAFCIISLLMLEEISACRKRVRDAVGSLSSISATASPNSLQMLQSKLALGSSCSIQRLNGIATILGWGSCWCARLQCRKTLGSACRPPAIRRHTTSRCTIILLRQGM